VTLFLYIRYATTELALVINAARVNATVFAQVQKFRCIHRWDSIASRIHCGFFRCSPLPVSLLTTGGPLLVRCHCTSRSLRASDPQSCQREQSAVLGGHPRGLLRILSVSLLAHMRLAGRPRCIEEVPAPLWTVCLAGIDGLTECRQLSWYTGCRSDFAGRICCSCVSLCVVVPIIGRADELQLGGGSCSPL
jgi:hypothetical protein